MIVNNNLFKLKKVNSMFKKAFFLGLLLTLGLTSVVAQDYVGTYLGKVTVTADVYLIGDIDNVNTEILNQELYVSSDYVGFIPNLPLYKDGGIVEIGFNNVTFAPNGYFSAPGGDYDSGMRFTDISGNISGNTINLTFRVLDVATGGTLLDATFNYTGIKQTTGINTFSVDADTIIVGYYSITGQRLNKEPDSGFYIVVYDNGKSEKVIKK